MMETMGKPDKDINESMKHICDVVQKRIDEAYQRGLKDGKEYGLDESDMREAVSYQKGLDDAWEAARKIAQQWEEDVDSEHRVVIDDSIRVTLDSMTASEAIAKLKAYEEQKADDEIKVGDEVEVLNSGSKYLIAWISGTSLCGFAHDGVTCRLQPSDVRKTGRHFDIAKILGEMKA